MDPNKIISPENLVYKKPDLLNDTDMHYCPGCSHGVVHKLIAEVIEEMGLAEKPLLLVLSDALFLPIAILMLIGWKPHTDELLL